jgi:hypothetical protein
LGYYGGNGARKMADLGTIPGTSQPSGINNSTTGLYDCSNWSISAQWAVPSTAVSGVYIAKLTRAGGGSNHIIFIVRDDSGNSDILFQLTDATWQAYNGYGGSYLYAGTTGFPNGRAVKVSYNRPIFPYNSGFATDNRQSDWYMNSEFPMIKWIERNGYSVSYTSCVEVARQGNLLLNHKVFMSAGHDEYWSKEQRENVEAARNAGIHCAFFTGNDVYWKTRWEADATGNAFHTLVCYKEGTMGDGTVAENACGNKCDGSTSIWTGLWRTGGNYDAGKPENSLTGQIGWVETNEAIQVPSTYKSHRFWRNTSIANMSSGQIIYLAPNTLGYEWNQEQYTSFYPSGRMKLSSTTSNGKTHNLSLYRHSSGALVFGAGTIQWSWGLDTQHYGGTNNVVSKDMQQATLNLFADMGVQPGSIQGDLIPASKSTDITPPSSVIATPQSGTQFTAGTTINISGSTSDASTVASVEISTNGGTTWIPLTGTSVWSYSWTPTVNGSYTILVRGWDDSGNKEIPGNAPASNAIFINIGTVTTPPTIQTHPQSQTVCEGSSVSFSSSVTQTPLPSVQWQVSTNGGTSWSNITGATSPTYTFISSLGDNGKRYRAVWTNSVGSTVSNSAVLTVNAIPAAPTGNLFINFCFAATVADLTANGTSIKWYSTASGGSSLASTTSLVNGNHYYASQTVNGCESNNRLDVTVAVNISTNTTFTLDGSRSAGSISSYLWTFVSGPNTPVIQNPTAAVTTVSGVLNGTYIFNLSLNGGLSQSRVLVNVNPKNALIKVHAGYDREITLPLSSMTLDGNGSSGPIKSYLWTKIGGPGNPVLTNNTVRSPQVSGLTEGTYSFELLIKDSSDALYRDTVNLKVNPAPLPSTPVIAKSQSLTGNKNTVVNSLSAVPAGSLLVLTLAQADEINDGLNPTITSNPSLTWTKRGGASSGLSGNAAIWTAVFNAGGNISITSVWGVEQMSCTVYALTNYDPALTGASAVATNQSAPNVSITTLKANSLVLGVISDWFAINGSSRVYTGTPTETFYDFKSGIYTAYHFQKFTNATGAYSMGLSSPTGMSAGVVLWEVGGVPAPPASPVSDAGYNQTVFLSVPPAGKASQTFCQNATVGNLVTDGNQVQWYTASTGGSLLSSTQALTNGSRYYASQLINGCETNLRLEVTAIVSIPPRDTTYVSVCSNKLPYVWRSKNYYTAGTFTDTLRNSITGCDTLLTLSLTVNALKSDTVSFAICSDKAPFLWYGRQLYTTGVYVDTVPALSGQCDSVHVLNLTVLNAPDIPSIDTLKQCDGSYLLTARVQGKYLWSTGDTLSSIHVNTSGTYSIQVSNQNGCTTSSSVTLSSVSIVFSTMVYDVVDVKCFGDHTGSFRIGVSGGKSPFLYSLDNVLFDTLTYYEGLYPGSYKIYVKDFSGCIATASAKINQPSSALTISVTKSNVAVHGAETGEIFILASGGTGNYTYRLGEGMWQDSGHFFRLPAGQYYASANDRNGCKVSQSVTIQEPLDDLSCTENNWVGGISSAWEDPLNWSCGTVPTSNSNVTIPSDPIFTPIINSHVVIQSIWLKSASNLVIREGFSLKVKAVLYPIQ